MAAFEDLKGKLEGIIRKIRGQGRISDSDIRDMSREIRLALLEADVHFKVVKEFVSEISEKARGKEVMESLTPGNQVVKIVHEELQHLLGDSMVPLQESTRPPSVYMLCGLQGSGKTTTCAKLAFMLKKAGKRPLLVACDTSRPAAVHQLEVLGKQVSTPVFIGFPGMSVPEIGKESIAFAANKGIDVVILDTAGRLHIDEMLMEELSQTKNTMKPCEILLVVDAMTGQDAVQAAQRFHEMLGITGVILTKLDGDTRGGAALSVKKTIGQPVKLVGVGEKPADLEPFHPDRMASRILGMGDVLSLIEKAQVTVDKKKVAELEKKLRTLSFNLEDYLEQIEELAKMGPLEDMLKMIPGVASKGLKVNEKSLTKTKAVIQSMTIRERQNPVILNARRRKRIAAGSGTTVQDVNGVLKQFEQIQQFMKAMKGRKPKTLKGFRMPYGI